MTVASKQIVVCLLVTRDVGPGEDFARGRHIIQSVGPPRRRKADNRQYEILCDMQSVLQHGFAPLEGPQKGAGINTMKSPKTFKVARFAASQFVGNVSGQFSQTFQFLIRHFLAGLNRVVLQIPFQ